MYFNSVSARRCRSPKMKNNSSPTNTSITSSRKSSTTTVLQMNHLKLLLIAFPRRILGGMGYFSTYGATKLAGCRPPSQIFLSIELPFGVSPEFVWAVTGLKRRRRDLEWCLFDWTTLWVYKMNQSCTVDVLLYFKSVRMRCF